MITGGRIPTIDEMTTDEYGLLSLTDIDPMDLRMSARQWKLPGLMPSGKALDHVSMYGTELSDQKNAENMYQNDQMFVNLPAEVITKGVSKLHMKNFPNSFAQNTSMMNQITQVGLYLYCVGFNNVALLCGIQQCFIDIQNLCVRATDELSRWVIEIAIQRPATLKGFRTKELALEMQT